MFFRLGGGNMFESTIEELWLRTRPEFRRWIRGGSDWSVSASPVVKEIRRRRTELLQGTVVAIRGCLGCGKPFELSAYRQQRGRDRVCSTECKGRARGNIEAVAIRGVRKTLSAWADERGVKIGTVWARIKRGWSIEQALKVESTVTPARRAESLRKNWATRRANGVVPLIEIDGEKLTMSEWCQRFNLAEGTVRHRIRHLGMSPVQALTTAPLRTRKPSSHRGRRRDGVER